MDVKLSVDGKEIALNEFVKRVLSGMIAGSVTSLRGIKEHWERIQIEVTNQA